MNSAVLDEETRLKKLVKDYFGDFVTARKTIEELEQTLQDKTFFTKDSNLVAEEVYLFHLLYRRMSTFQLIRLST